MSAGDVHSYPELLVRCIALRCELVVPTPFQLCVDVDAPFRAGYELRGDVQGHLAELFGPIQIESWPSRNGNTHVLITLAIAPISAEERIALQAACGSDPHREIKALIDIRGGRPYPSVLFKPLPRQITDGRP